jgi:formylglycine-generating enzyme required for sulfatase activity
MTRRDILIASVGTALGLSGCKAVSRSVVPATIKTIEKNGFSGSSDSVTVKSAAEGYELARQRRLSSLSSYPALKAYLQELRDIPAGSFRYEFFHGQPQAAPIVDVPAFRMGSTPVTWAIWKEYCKAEGVSLPKEPDWGRLDNHPVLYVSYDDIVGTNGGGGFCGWASRLAGFDVALPTDVQYEYASRGGRDGYDYPWGNEFDTSNLWCAARQTAAVDRTDRIYRNGYGLTDMAGNGWEWCSTDELLGMKSARGGGYLDHDKDSFRCASKAFFSQDDRMSGFRLAAPA